MPFGYLTSTVLVGWCTLFALAAAAAAPLDPDERVAPYLTRRGDVERVANISYGDAGN